MDHFPDIPPVWAAGIAITAVILSRLVPLASFSAPTLIIWAALASGFLVILWSAYFFWKKKTSIEPHHKPRALIVEGPYRVSRNPIYLGMALGVFAIALWSGGLSGVLVSLLFPVVVTRRFIVPEEAALRSAFGAEAEAYLARTARWIGR